jgi:hypothetical protein
MTLWHGLLPLLFLLPVSDNARAKLDGDWRRPSSFDLPATIQVLSTGTAGDTTRLAIGRIVLTRHRLVSSPEAVIANR